MRSFSAPDHERRARWAAPLVALGLALASSPAAADPPAAQDEVLAEVLFRDAKTLLDAGKVGEACDKLAESHRLDPKPGTALNLASCREKQGRTASAWAAYADAASMAARAGQAPREEYARSQAAAMEALLSRVRIDVAAALPGLAVTLDGRTIAAPAWGTAIPVDPGEHAIEARAPGFKPWIAHVTANSGPVTLPVLVPSLDIEAPIAPPPPPPPAALPPSPPPPSPLPRDPPDDASGRRLAGYAIGGVGVAGIVVGAIFGARTFAKKSEGDRFCSGTPCSQHGLDLQREASTSATISTIGFAAGLAGIGAGVALWVTARPAKPAARVWIAPAASASSASLTAAGTW